MSRVVGQVQAVDGISFEIMPGETLGLVGESGCGKTTVGRLILQLLKPTSGSVLLEGTDIATLDRAGMKRFRRDVQIIFQDPYSSLNPRMRVFDIVGEALRVHGIAKGEELEAQVELLLGRVGVAPGWVNRFPHEFSGGQRQRIGIARAIAMNPKLVVCDEAVSALDVSIQAQVLNLLIDLREELGFAYLFISHDLSVVRHVSHRVAVMYLGQIVELASVDELFSNPRHPYTRALLSAVPVPNPRARKRRLILHGDVPTPLNPPSGCRFHTRCPIVIERCRSEEPPVDELPGSHLVKCFLAGSNDGPWLDTQVEAPVHEQGPDRASAVSVARATPERASSAQAGQADVATTPTGPSAGLEPVPAGARPSTPRPILATLTGMAALIVACALVLGSWWVVGACVGLAGYLMVPRARWTTRRSGGGRRAVEGRTFIPYWVGLALSITLSLPLSAQRKQWRAERELGALSAELEDYRVVTGAFPKSLGGLGWRLYEHFSDGKPVDPWGTSYRFHASDSGGYHLGSWGADRVLSADDIGEPPPLLADGVAAASE
jgi:oligopeptide/dipeptide ABC transporter ATP-binding protein